MAYRKQKQELKVRQEDWMVKKWRPAMGWTYMAICILDMAVFPIAWSILQASTKQPLTQWTPLTLQGGGMFHVAMGAVLGISAWSRGREKMMGADNNYENSYDQDYDQNQNNQNYQNQNNNQPNNQQQNYQPRNDTNTP